MKGRYRTRAGWSRAVNDPPTGSCAIPSSRRRGLQAARPRRRAIANHGEKRSSEERCQHRPGTSQTEDRYRQWISCFTDTFLVITQGNPGCAGIGGAGVSSARRVGLGPPSDTFQSESRHHEVRHPSIPTSPTLNCDVSAPSRLCASALNCDGSLVRHPLDHHQRRIVVQRDAAGECLDGAEKHFARGGGRRALEL